LNIGERYWNARLSDIPRDAPHRNKIMAYAKDILNNRRKGWGLALWGDNSTGKTHIACAMLVLAARLGLTGFCIMADELKAMYINQRAFDETMSVARRCETVDFLLIEDVGTEYEGRGKDWARLNFENLLRRRYKENRPVIMTSNYMPKQYAQRYEKSAASLAVGSMLWVEVAGENWRLKEKRTKLAAFQTQVQQID